MRFVSLKVDFMVVVPFLMGQVRGTVTTKKSSCRLFLAFRQRKILGLPEDAPKFSQ
jgi:hypothetical protein